MKSNQPVFELQHGVLLIPAELREKVSEQVIVSAHGGSLYLFPAARWDKLIDKLAAAKPSPERHAALRMICLAVEVGVSAGRLELPESILSRLNPEADVLLVGKQIGMIARTASVRYCSGD